VIFRKQIRVSPRWWDLLGMLQVLGRLSWAGAPFGIEAVVVNEGSGERKGESGSTGMCCGHSQCLRWCADLHIVSPRCS
jgi:hypothetical protein